MDAATAGILLNREVIALDQDRSGRQARLVRDENGVRLWTKPLANGDTAVVLLNRGEAPKTVTTTAHRIRDLWAHTSRTGPVTTTIPPHDVVAYRLSSA
ncbi:hypothetical protein [Cryptosporangium arvum]|uniref:hypothetical protein n=1 Tax=Cryptosporangium arvum TaxID=80871 RepID=UPI0004B544ED|nr:hypothetical protein [Cryptosporangium arvum]